MEENKANLDFLIENTKLKRDARLLHSMLFAMLDEYINSNFNWRQTTFKTYLHIIIDYIGFSPIVD